MPGVIVAQLREILTVVCHGNTIPNVRSIVNGRDGGNVGNLNLATVFDGPDADLAARD
jgi:hypothetical protein